MGRREDRKWGDGKTGRHEMGIREDGKTGRREDGETGNGKTGRREDGETGRQEMGRHEMGRREDWGTLNSECFEHYSTSCGVHNYILISLKETEI